MKIYGISIRAPRLAALTERLGTTPFTVVDGVNGNALSYKELLDDKIYKPLSYLKFTRGAIGCYLSHRSVWEYILKGSDEYALILEDDADFKPDKIETLELLISQLKAFDPNWNFLIIGSNTKVGTRGMRAPPGFFVPSRAFGLHAYIVSKRGASTLLAKSIPIIDPVDLFVTSLACRGKYATTTGFCDVLNFGSDVIAIA